MGVCQNLIANAQPSELYFLFSSQGGAVDSAIVLYNYLRSLACKITMHNISMIASSATVLFHAADVRYASPHSTFHFHGLTWTFFKEEVVTRARIDELRSFFIEGEKRMAGIIQSRCKLTKEMLEGMFKQGESKDTTFALEHGIIQEIREPKIPADGLALVFDPNA